MSIVSRPQKKFTIGIDARMYGNRQTGIGNYIANLIDGLAGIKHNCRFVIFLREPYFSSLKFTSKRFKKVKADIHWYNFKEQVFMPFITQRARVDLMHYPHFNVPILNKIPYIVTIHDLTPFRFPGKNAGKHLYRRLIFQAVFKKAIQNSRAVIAVSQATKNDILELMPKANISVIKEGVNNFDFSLKRKINIFSKYNLRRPFIFYTGVWREHKNISALIAAFRILIDKYGFDGDLVLGGEEDKAYPEARQAISILGLSSRVKAVGFIPEKELPLFYSFAKAFVFPSFSEGFGLVGLEAWQCGTPLAVSNIPALKEIYNNAAIYFNPFSPSDMAAKLNILINDKKLSCYLVAKGRENLKKYKWRTTAKKTLALYTNTTL